MPFNIAEFNAAVSKSGIAQTSHFEGWILGGPGSHQKSAGGISPLAGLEQGMRFRIESLNMPGRTLTTLDQNYHGPSRAIPYRFTQQPVSLSIILSKDMREREVFMKWQDYLIGHSRNDINGNLGGIAPFDSRYYYDGVGTIQIRQYSYPLGTATNNQAAQNKEDSSKEKLPGQTATQAAGPGYELQTYINLLEAYPIAVNDIQLSWGDEGYAKLQVEIRYHRAVEWNKNWGNQGQLSQEATNKNIAGIFKDNVGLGNV
jgi:hypothetical protein